MLSQIEMDKIRSLVSTTEGIGYVILFGSALRRLLAHSDIDLLIGGDLNSDQKADLSMKLTLGLGRQVDIVCSKEADCEVVLRGLSSGVPIVVRNKARVREDYFRHYRLCDNGRLLKRIRLERLKRVYCNG